MHDNAQFEKTKKNLMPEGVVYNTHPQEVEMIIITLSWVVQRGQSPYGTR